MELDVASYRRVAERWSTKEEDINPSAAAVLMLQMCSEIERLRGGWIPTSERLPADDEWVWCYGPNRGCEAAFISKYWDGWVGTDRKNLVAGAYTHWMPLPEPPEVK
jgi:hypothetical protein